MSEPRHLNTSTIARRHILPDTHQIESEIKRVKKKKSSKRIAFTLLFALITVSAVCVLLATLFFPVLRIYGASMTPTLDQGEIVVAVKISEIERGDVISFYYNNKVLVKRAIAFEGDLVDIDSSGSVSVNGVKIDEPYLSEKSPGECDLQLPYQVPAGKIFVMGDHRATSVDSRSSVMGCVSKEQIVGKILLRVWPLNAFGEIK